MKKKAKTKKTAAECDLCGDNEAPLVLHARCHFTAPLQATLEGNILTLSCYIPECARVVTRFEVARIVPTEVPT